MYGRQITLQENLTDASGNPIYDDGFLAVQNINENAESGYIFRDKLSNLVEDYNTSLETYNQQMEDREFGKLGWFQELLDDVKSQAIGAAVDFIPGGEIASFLVDKNLTLGADSSDIAEAVNNSGKAILGQGYDFLSNMIFGENVDPVRPSIPAASFSEMRFSGSVTTQNYVPLVGFINPGSNFIGSDLTPFNYPAYNEVLGLYATLRTPEVELMETNYAMNTFFTNIEVVVDSSDWEGPYIFSPASTRIDSTIWKTSSYSQNLYLKLKKPLEYALNKALDFDTIQTEVYVSFDVKLETETPFQESLVNINRIDSIRYEVSQNTNLWTIHDISAGNYPGNILKRKIELVSGWYEVKDITNLLFGSTISTSVYYTELYESEYFATPWEMEQPWFDGEGVYENHLPYFTKDHLKYKPVQITMKVMADMYFEQPSYTGEQINTTQVFTYLLLDKEKGINLIADQGNMIPPVTSPPFARMYPGKLTIQSTVLYPNCAEVILSNSLIPFSIFADRIEIKEILGGLDGSNGLVYNLYAYSEIMMKPGTHLLPNLRLGIYRNLYGGDPSKPATSSELVSFCQSNSYNSGTLSRQAKNALANRRLERIKQDKPIKLNDIQNKISVSPNPANSHIWVTSSSTPITEVEIFDLSGRSLIHQKVGDELQRVKLDIHALQSGVYIVQTRCGDARSTQKLVVGR